MPFFFRSHFSVFLFSIFVLTLFLFMGRECFAQGGGVVEVLGVAQAQQELQGGGGAAGAGGEPAVAPPAALGEVKKTELKKKSDELLDGGGWWGPGGYFSPIKLAFYVLLFVVWVGMASWINADQERLRRENREVFNLVYLLLY